MPEALTLAEPELGPAGAAYERFLREAPETGDDYLRTDARVRFEPHDDDVLLAPLGLSVSESTAGAVLAGGTLPRAVVVPGVPRERVAAFLAALDGSATLARARISGGLEPDAERALLKAAFGVALFAPHAVTALERAVSASELVRFPGSPYEIERNYWANMAAVRRASASSKPASTTHTGASTRSRSSTSSPSSAKTGARSIDPRAASCGAA